MNIFSLLFIMLSLGLVVAGTVLLIIAIIKKKWKLGVLAIIGTIVGYAVMTAVGFVAISFMDFRLKREVTSAEVIGAWKLRDESLSLALQDGYKPAPGAIHQLDVRADGSCRYRSIRSSYPPSFEEFEGSWRIKPAFGEKQIYELSISIAKKGGSMFSVYFTEEKGQLVIWEYLGDPDSGTYLKFDKQPNKVPEPMPMSRTIHL